MDLGLHDRTALVAASSRGLGRAIADELAAAGANLVLCARSADALMESAEAIRRSSAVRVVAVPADVAVAADVERVVAAAEAELGGVDILVTNSGGPPAGRFENHDAAAWEAAARQLLFSAVGLARRVVPGMRARRWGRVVTITSIAVKQPVEDLILSNSLRAAVAGFARSLANEVAADGVTVNNVMPGYTRTERLEELATRMASKRGVPFESRFDVWNDEIPMRRLGEPHELAALVAFLCSARAGYITGTSIPVDGGWIRSLL
jgi:3-oxoacyl-[acyl-carrier protein] reductase